MTSNAGTAELGLKGKVGFKDDNNPSGYNEEQIIKAALSKYFRIEFLNRIDEQIVFKKLSNESIKKIVKLKLDSINDILKPKRIKLLFSDNVVDFISDNSYDEKYGARPIVRAISKEIQTPLSQKVLSKEITDGMSVQVDYDKVEKKIYFHIIPAQLVDLGVETIVKTIKKQKGGRNKNTK